MTSLPVGATHAQPANETRNGDAVVVRGVAAFLALLALASLFVVPRPAAYVVAATIVAGALGLFFAARWRRRA